MPSPTEQLFESLAKRQFSKTLELLQNDSDLVNAVHAKTGLSFFKYTEGRARTEEIIKYVVTHDKFDLQFTDKKGTNLDHIIRCGLHNLILQLAENSNIIYNHDELTFKTAVTILEVEKINHLPFALNPSEASTHQKRIEKIKQAISHIRDITILYAIKHDDAELMQQLDAAGGDCSEMLGTLGNGKLPTMLLTPHNTKIKAMFSKQVDEELIKLSQNSNTFFNDANEMKHGEMKAAEVEQKFQDRMAQSDQKAAAGYKEILDDTTKVMKGC